MNGFPEERVKVLSGPFGNVLKELGQKIGVSDLEDATKIVEGGVYRQATFDLLRRYLPLVDVPTTNTFGARVLLRKGQPESYREVIRDQIKVALEALAGTSGKHLVVPFGSFGCEGGGCYNPKEAPSDANEARDFHEQQVVEVIEWVRKGVVEAVVFETISTGKEALGAVLAAKKFRIPVIPSFVVDATGNLKTGERLADVMRDIDNITGNYPLGYSVNCCPLAGAEAAIGHANGKRDRLIMAYPNASDADPSTLEEVFGAVSVRDHHTTAAHLIRMTMNNKSLKIVGGCCGFDPEAIDTIARAIKTGFR